MKLGHLMFPVLCLFVVQCFGCGKSEKLNHTRLKQEYVAPRDPAEVRMAELWEDVLDVRPIGMRDNFFDLGGDFQTASELFCKIEKTTGMAFAPGVIFETPTVEQMSEILRRKDWSPRWECLVPIRPEGDKRPMFFVHPVGGNVFGFVPLADSLGSDQPIFGLRAIGLDGKKPPQESVEDMAARYIKEIKLVCPEGPYRVGGRCAIGGMVAYEIAQKLLVQGEQVELLAMIDVRTAPTLRVEESKRARRTPSSDNSSRDTRSWLEKVRSLFESPQSRRFRHVREAIDRAYRKYVPKPYPGHISYFISEKQWTKKPYRFLPDSQAGWQNLALGGLTFNLIPGDHLTMMQQPHVEIVADKLKAFLGEKPEINQNSN